MTIDVSGFVIKAERTKAQGLTWVVRLYKKNLLRKKRITSDWFLDEEQAHTFAQTLAEQLKAGIPTNTFISRTPGWTLSHARR